MILLKSTLKANMKNYYAIFCLSVLFLVVHSPGYSTQSTGFSSHVLLLLMYKKEFLFSLHLH